MLISAKKNQVKTFIYIEDIDSSSNLFLVEEPVKQFFISPGNPTYENENKTKRRLVLHGDYSNIANCQTKIPAIFRDNMEFFLVISRFLVVYSTPKYVFRNCYWENTVQNTKILNPGPIAAPVLLSSLRFSLPLCFCYMKAV